MRTRFSGIIVALLLALVLLPVFVSTTARAQDRQTRKYTDEELLELVGMTVEAASKRPEPIMEAPGVVSVLTANEIRELGVLDLAQAVEYMAGVMTFKGHGGETDFFAIRGQVHAWNKKILLLVNGHPVYAALNGVFDLSTIPIEAVERIELIRGPVSVMYGTNALTGVINIVTKREPDFINGEARVQYGSFGTLELRAALGKKYENSHYFLAGTLRKQDGYDYVVKPEQDQAGKGLSHKQYSDVGSVFMNLAYGSLEVDVSYGKDSHPSTLGFMPSSLSQPIKWGLSHLYSDVRYAYELNERSKLNFNLRLDSACLSVDTIDLDVDTEKGESQKYGAEIFGDFKLSDKLRLLTGALHDRYHTGVFKPTYYLKIPGVQFKFYKPEESTWDTAAYANLNYLASPAINLVWGVRFTDNSITEGHVDYRLGSIFNLKKDLALKVLYGTSYRSPNHHELFLNAYPVVMGNRNLDVEVLYGFDLSLNYVYKSSLFASVSYFWNKGDDYISLRPIEGVSTHVNMKGNEVQGVEFELKYRLSSLFNMFFNASNILSGKDLETDTDLVIVKNTFNFGLAFRPSEHLTISSSNIYRGDWGESKAYFLSNLSVFFLLPNRYPQFEFLVTVNNLFNTEYTFAEAIAFRVPTIPGGPPRSITAGIVVSF